MIQVEDFKKWLGILLAEAFGLSETPSGYFLDSGQAGLFGTINAITAEIASSTPKPGGETIVSHCAHLLYSLHFFNAYEQGQTPPSDWASSWSSKVADEPSWAALRVELKSSYETLTSHLQARDDWSEPPLAASMMLLAHTAYHVGEIKQLLTSLKL